MSLSARKSSVKIPPMFRILPILLFAATALGSAPVTVTLPVAAFPDGEVSAVVAVPVMPSGARGLVVTLALVASPTNNVEVALGDVVFGWDCGEWFVRGDNLREYFSVASSAVMGELVTVSASVALDARGAPVSVTLEGVPMSGTVSAAWFAGASALALTARGGGEGVTASVAFKVPGSVVIMR